LDVALKRLNGTSCKVDKEVYTWHHNGKLTLVLSAHVDDLKITGEDDWIQWLLTSLEKDVGKMTVHKNGFTHCGIVHEQPDRFTVVLHQEPYAKQLKSMTVPSGPEQQTLDTKAHSAYRTLLGGVSWLTLTRYDIAVYVCALQRYSQTPQVRHAVALNRLLKYILRTPFRCYYRRLQGPLRLIVISDSAFRKEDKDGLAMRGCIVALTELHDGQPGGKMQVLEHYSRKQKRVCRSTFSAELNALVDALESGKVVMFMITELMVGSCSAEDLQQREELGRWPLPLECAVDAKSVFAAAAVADSKNPLEESLVTLVLIIREALQAERISKLWWIDTRDMLSDALTKGSCPRQALLDVAKKGEWNVAHTSEWTSFKKQTDNARLTFLVEEALTGLVCDKELPRQEIGLKLYGDFSALVSYALQDEAHRSFAGLASKALGTYDADFFFRTAINGITWKRPADTSGRPMRRSTSWMTTSGCSCKYSYGKFQVAPDDMPFWLHGLWKQIQMNIGTVDVEMPNSCNANFYEDCGDGITWHADDETLFAAGTQDACIYSLSLGSTATFEIRKRDGKGSLHSLELHHGDLCTMEGLCQKHYLHRIRPNAFRGGRINLTWRSIIQHDGNCWFD
jgi:alkylated DNA repair dioxygenase AlkB